MLRPRVIPVLLLKDKGLVKSKRFGKYDYIGDPLNAVRIFNRFKTDELIFLDIMASREKRLIPIDFVRHVFDEALMPFAAGGGISSLEDIRSLIQAGSEKVVINKMAAMKPEFIREAADSFGSSSIVVCMDVKKNWLGKWRTWIMNGRQSTGMDPVEFAMLMENMGAGEIIVQSIARDGTMSGYDIPLIKSISKATNVPVVALGGAGKLDDLRKAY